MKVFERRYDTIVFALKAAEEAVLFPVEALLFVSWEAKISVTLFLIYFGQKKAGIKRIRPRRRDFVHSMQLGGIRHKTYIL
ncbi:MAG: hypothetical protein ABFS56_30145 [Pseudomonadota bacterium]